MTRPARVVRNKPREPGEGSVLLGDQGDGLKVAVTERGAVIDGLHEVGEVPKQAPDQPENTNPGAGVGVRVATVP